MPIIYYDGNCIYCYNYAIWLIQNGLSKSYEFATIKGEIGEQFFNQHPEAKNRNSVILQKVIIQNINQTQLLRLLLRCQTIKNGQVQV